MRRSQTGQCESDRFEEGSNGLLRRASSHAQARRSAGEGQEHGDAHHLRLAGTLGVRPPLPQAHELAARDTELLSGPPVKQFPTLCGAQHANGWQRLLARRRLVPVHSEVILARAGCKSKGLRIPLRETLRVLAPISYNPVSGHPKADWAKGNSIAGLDCGESQRGTGCGVLLSRGSTRIT